MPKPKGTVWELDPHSIGKHKVLREYLNAWFPILSRYNKRILFVDGFAGPGVYKNGEPGSPLIAIDVLEKHRNNNNVDSEVACFFIEDRNDRANHLESVLKDKKDDIKGDFKYEVIKGKFDETMTYVIGSLEEQKKNLAPAFIMIDPFGVSDTPMSVIKKILRNDRSEIYITFMYDAINRFISKTEFHNHLDDLFGCLDWRDAIDINDTEERKEFLFDLYKTQLKSNGAKYVVNFELYEENRSIYTIFFATKDLLGCDKMKQAIWKVDPFGSFSFRGSSMPELELTAAPDTTKLKNLLLTKYKNKGWVPIDDLKKFVMSDETMFHSNHLKTKTLKPMEKDSSIIIDESTRKTKRGYPDGTLIKFTGDNNNVYQ